MVRLQRIEVGALFGGIAVLVVATQLMRTWAVGAVGFDSAAAVLYFQRITGGVHLETFLGATPKPTLTALFGVAYALTGDWRSIAVLTIGAYALGIALAMVLAYRVAGSSAAAFAFVAIFGSQLLLEDVALSYATPLALTFLLIAGLALTRTRPAYALAGVAMMLASLARLEAIVLPAISTIAVVALWFADRRWPKGDARAGRAAPLLIGLLAIPIMFVHDLALTGDPTYWLQVSARYSELNPDTVRSPAAIVSAFVQRYGPMAPFIVLAVIGEWWTISRRAFPLALGMAGTALGVAALLFLLAARGTYVSTRYFLLIDLSILLAAAIGFGAIVELVRARQWGYGLPALPRLSEVAVIVLAGLVAFAFSRPWAPLDRATRRYVEDQVQISANADAAVGVILSSRANPRCTRDPSASVVLPGLMTPRISVGLAWPLDRIAALVVDANGRPNLPLGGVAYLIHERHLDRSLPLMPGLEGATPTSLDHGQLVPIHADASAGIWVYEACPAATP
jgi:hypothetical protein